MSTQKDEKQHGSKLVYKKQAFEMDKQAGLQPGVAGNTGPAEASGAEKKTKSSLVFKKQHDFNPESMPAPADAKPQISQMFSAPFIPQTTQIPTMATTQPATTYPMTAQGSYMQPAYNPMMMTMPMPMNNMANLTPWGYMGGFNPTGAQVASVPTVSIPATIPVPTVQPAPTTMPQVQVTASTTEKWREAMRQKLQAGKQPTLSSTTSQKTEATKEEIKKDEPLPTKVESPKKEEPRLPEVHPQKAQEVTENKDSDSDGDSYNDEPAVTAEDKVFEEEDYSKYPQERPKKIIYSRDMIMEFIRREADREDQDLDDQFEDLMRDIQIINKTPGFRPTKQYNDRPGRGSRPSRNTGGPRKDNPSSTYTEPKPGAAPAPVHQRVVQA